MAARPTRPTIPWRLAGVTTPTASDAETGRVLARAFHDDPLFTYVEPDPARRRRSLDWLFTRLVLTAKDGRRSIVPGQGVLLWFAPPAAELTVRRIVRAGMVRTPAILGWPATIRLLRGLAAVDGVGEAAHAKDDWYVYLLAVDPDHQGKRLAHRLLSPVLAMADAAGARVRLETANPKNVGFYESFGFEVADVAAPGNIPPQWLMVRPPRDTRLTP